MIRHPFRWLVAFAGLGLGTWATLESRRVAQIAGEFEVVARGATAAAADAVARATDAEQALVAAHQQVARLEGELDTALTYAYALGEALTHESEARERAAVDRASVDAMVAVPPPLGVRHCLQALRECLRADGYSALRPLRASAVEDSCLRDVELLDGGVGDAADGASLIVAERMTATLDRSRGSLSLRFFAGTQRVQGVRSELPAAGLLVRLAPVAGPMWEARLPYLVRAEGAYPADAGAADAVAAAQFDVVTRAQWLERFDLLLAASGTDLELRVAGFRAMVGGRFQAVQLFGYDRGHLLALAADCGTLAVEINDRAGIVSLLLCDGTLRREGVESSIHADGYRMLLPNVTPRRAAELMLGMVVHR